MAVTPKPKAPVKQTGKNFGNLPGPGPGRPAGVPNKTTKALKEMILGALDGVGGEEYLMAQAKDLPSAFLTLIGNVLPTTLQGDPNAPLATVMEVRLVRPRD